MKKLNYKPKTFTEIVYSIYALFALFIIIFSISGILLLKSQGVFTSNEFNENDSIMQIDTTNIEKPLPDTLIVK